MIEIKSNVAEVKTVISKQIDIMKNYEIPMKQIASELYAGVMKNFKEQGTGKAKWAPFSARTLYAKAHRKHKKTFNPTLLQDTGFLKNSIYPKSGKDYAYVSTNVPYAKFHQFGTKKIPARPFLVIRDDTKEKIIDICKKWFFPGEKE